MRVKTKVAHDRKSEFFSLDRRINEALARGSRGETLMSAVLGALSDGQQSQWA